MRLNGCPGRGPIIFWLPCPALFLFCPALPCSALPCVLYTYLAVEYSTPVTGIISWAHRHDGGLKLAVKKPYRLYMYMPFTNTMPLANLNLLKLKITANCLFRQFDKHLSIDFIEPINSPDMRGIKLVDRHTYTRKSPMWRINFFFSFLTLLAMLWCLQDFVTRSAAFPLDIIHCIVNDSERILTTPREWKSPGPLLV